MGYHVMHSPTDCCSGRCYAATLLPQLVSVAAPLLVNAVIAAATPAATTAENFS
jgi:hypothetical protein